MDIFTRNIAGYLKFRTETTGYVQFHSYYQGIRSSFSVTRWPIWSFIISPKGRGKLLGFR